MSKLAWDYIVPVVLPKDLKGIEPGNIPANLLRAVPGGGKMHWIAASAWSAMVEKAKVAKHIRSILHSDPMPYLICCCPHNRLEFE